MKSEIGKPFDIPLMTGKNIDSDTKMVTQKSWKEFRDSGMLWWINMILHTFGWAICLEAKENGTITNAFPARVRFRGFSDKNNSEGYKKVSQYMRDNVDKLLKESEE